VTRQGNGNPKTSPACSGEGNSKLKAKPEEKKTGPKLGPTQSQRGGKFAGGGLQNREIAYNLREKCDRQSAGQRRGNLPYTNPMGNPLMEKKRVSGGQDYWSHEINFTGNSLSRYLSKKKKKD